VNSYDTCFFFLLVTGRADLRQDQEGFGTIPIMVMDATFVLIQLAGLGWVTFPPLLSLVELRASALYIN
jgi:hypothetical protein